jgi:hypothetical protein
MDLNARNDSNAIERFLFQLNEAESKKIVISRLKSAHRN